MEADKAFVVGEEHVHERLDVFLHRHFPDVSRSRIQKLIALGKISVNDSLAKPGHKLSSGDSVVVCALQTVPERVVPEKIPLDILYEDEEILVVNKSAGMITHPVDAIQRGTLVHALLAHTEKLSAINGPLRPGIVHRLDKDTSGALLIAKTDRSYLHIRKQMEKRKLKRKYKAIVLGRVEPEEGRIVAPIGRHVVLRQKMSVRYTGGREAITNYKVVEKFQIGDLFFCLLSVSLETGRTHQIRVHLASIGHPVAGDKKYGKKCKHIFMNRQALHAEVLGFIHPATEEYIEFTAPVPEDMVKQIEELK